MLSVVKMAKSDNEKNAIAMHSLGVDTIFSDICLEFLEKRQISNAIATNIIIVV